MYNGNNPVIDVLVCTYRRPELLNKTLVGIQHCAEHVGSVRIIVVDNDAEHSALEVVERWNTHAPVEVIYLAQPVQNISLTRNMALEHASAPWIALIDDDEVPDENWLSALLETAKKYNADIVFGPVIAQFGPAAPAWATTGMLFQRKRFATGEAVPLRETRTGNVLLRGARIAKDAFRFDPQLGLSGGEDTEFFSRLAQSGYSMVWCDNACVREWTPSSRTTLSWVTKRGFRIGSVEAYNLRRSARLGKLFLATGKILILFGVGIASGIICSFFSQPRAVRELKRAAYASGFLYGLINGPFEEYRKPEQSRTREIEAKAQG